MVKRNPSFLHTSPSVLLMTGNVSSLENHAQGLSHDDVWSVNGLSVVRQSLTNCLSTNKDIYNERGRCSYLTVTQDRTYYLIILQGFLSKHFNLEVAWRPTVCFFFFFNCSQDTVTDTVTNREAEFISKKCQVKLWENIRLSLGRWCLAFNC